MSERWFENVGNPGGRDENADWYFPVFAITEKDFVSSGDMGMHGVFCHAAPQNTFAVYTYLPMKMKGFLGKEKITKGISIYKRLTTEEVLLLVRCFFDEKYDDYEQLKAKQYDMNEFICFFFY